MKLYHGFDQSKICKLCYNKVHKECTMFTPPESEERLPLRYCSRCFYIVDESIKTNVLDSMYRTLPQIIESDLAPAEVISEQEAFFEYYAHNNNRHYRFSLQLKIESEHYEVFNEGIVSYQNPEENYYPPPSNSIKKIVDNDVNSKKVYHNMIGHYKEAEVYNNEGIENDLEPPALFHEDSFEKETLIAIEESKKTYGKMLESNSRKQQEDDQREIDRIANENYYRIQETLRSEEEYKGPYYNYPASQHNNNYAPINNPSMTHQSVVSDKSDINQNSGCYNEKIVPGHYPKLSGNDFSTNHLPPAQPYVNDYSKKDYTYNSSTIFTGSNPTPPAIYPPQFSPGYLNYNPEIYNQNNFTTVDTTTPTYTYDDITQSRVFLPVVPPSANEIPNPESIPAPLLNSSLINQSYYEVIPVLQPNPNPNVSVTPTHESLNLSEYSFIGSRRGPNLNSSRISFYQHIKPIKEDPKNYYQLQKKIGTGSIGQVFLARELTTNKNFAIKLLSPSSEGEKTLILNEVNLTINSHHENIIKYHKLFEHDNEIWIVEELMACSLADLVLDRPGQIPERIVVYLLKEILLGLSYLHERQRIHRDIKSDNILLSLDGDVKIGDLGYCVQVSNENPNRQTFAGTLLWMAPEVLNQSLYSSKIDVWSLGIIALELITGEPPYYKDGQQKIVMNISRREAPRVNRQKYNISDELDQFICACLNKNPAQRADCNFLSSMPIISNCPCDVSEFRQYFEEWKLNR